MEPTSDINPMVKNLKPEPEPRGEPNITTVVLLKKCCNKMSPNRRSAIPIDQCRTQPSSEKFPSAVDRSSYRDPHWTVCREWDTLKCLSSSSPSSWGLGNCLSQGFYSCTNIMTKKQVGEERDIQLTFPHCCSSPKEVRTGTQAGQEAGADAEAMEVCSLLACFPWLAQPALL